MLFALLVAAVVTGRPVLAALAVPFAVAVLVAVATPRCSLRLHLQVQATESTEGDAIPVFVTIEASTAVELSAVRVAGGDIGLEPDAPTWSVLALAAGERRTVTVMVTPKRWGRIRIGPAYVVHRSGLLSRSGTSATGQMTVNVHPRPTPLQADVAMPRSRAYAGTHASRTTGPGVRFDRLRPFQPGDTRRTVNWRATARRQELLVNVTDTDLSADIVLVVDALHDIPDPAGAGSSLDISARAMSGLLEHYLRLGDRVGLLEWSSQQRTLRPGAGRAQLLRGRDWLLDVVSREQAATPLFRWPREFEAVNPLTLVFSPLVDEASLALLALLRGRGLPVVAVDTLPPGAPMRSNDVTEELTRRLWLLRRDERLARLAELGASVVDITTEGSLARVVADLARLAAAPRLTVR